MKLTAPDAEVVIIGGGPAGAATGISLAQAGRKVIICEARDFRQSQPNNLGTGEVLSPGAQVELEKLGLPCQGAAWRLDDFDRLRQYWTTGQTTVQRLPGKLRYWQTERGEFDHSLLDFAAAKGVEVLKGQRVSGVMRAIEQGPVTGVTLQGSSITELRSRVVVDASGRRSPLLARLNLKEPETEFQRMALVCFFSEVPQTIAGEWEQHFLGRGNTTLNGSRMRDGLYRFTLETDITMREQFKHLHRPLDLFLAILELVRPALVARFTQATPISYATAFAPVGYRVSRPVQAGLVLVGDTTGYLDPATGQGIEFALRTARLAGRAIEEAFKKGDFSAEAFALYQVGLEKEIARARRDLRLYLRLTRRARLLRTLGQIGPLRAIAVRRLVRPRPAIKI